MENHIKDIRLFVLNILKEGRITVEEADKIISFINSTEELVKSKKKDIDVSTSENITNIAKEGVSKLEKFVSDISGNLEKVAQNIGTRLNIQTDTPQQTTTITEKYAFVETKNITIEPSVTKLVLENNWGGIKIIGEEREDILLNIKKIIWTKNEELANDRSEAFKTKISKGDEVITVILPEANPNLRDTVSLEMFIPMHMELDLATSTGDILLYDLENLEKSLKLKTSSGNVEVKPVKFKNTSINTINGDVLLRDVDSLLNIQTTSGDIEFHGLVNSESRVTSISGDIRGRVGVNQNLEIVSSSGSIDFKQNKTKECNLVDFITNSGDINYRGVILNKLRIRTNNGEIKGQSSVTNQGNLEINSTNGDVTWKTEDYNSFKFNCESKDGDVFTNIENDDVIKTPKSVIGKVNNGDGNVSINTVSGDIRLNIANIAI